MKKSIKLSLQIIAILILGYVCYFAIILFTGDPYYKRLALSISSLECIRSNLELYKQEQGNYPQTLKDLQEYVSQVDSEGYFNRENKEYISIMTGNYTEFNTLNGEGGWYYNKENGEVRINITQPLKNYFKNDLKFSRRNKVPADW